MSSGCRLKTVQTAFCQQSERTGFSLTAVKRQAGKRSPFLNFM
ncbi:hypothetical protein F528_1558 [Neisseria meningitidis 992008]|uniref:Uncharacterized protein n=2 Tax=Neisseria meningitidis TaxID=487 RepID=A0A0H5Q9T1_NEIMI|nr:hypothetical protein NMA510612_1908 [Neisseria meningitidis]KER39494.1 hypothetical protein F528_1558 [Neisseria meningitidis 992008]CRY98792.1 hypothetical protein [Neisseria meningitidis serogroup B]